MLGTTDNLGFTPEPSDRAHTYLVALNITEDGALPLCPYLDDSLSSHEEETDYALHPLIFIPVERRPSAFLSYFPTM